MCCRSSVSSAVHSARPPGYTRGADKGWVMRVRGRRRFDGGTPSCTCTAHIIRQNYNGQQSYKRAILKSNSLKACFSTTFIWYGV
jgi:hypothetical protein